MPVPPAEMLGETEKQIKDLFKDEYQKRGAAERAELARKLLKVGEETKDDLIAQYVALREAKDVALAAGDIGTAFAAVDALTRGFALDGAELKADLLVAGARTATPEDAEKLATLGTDLLEQLSREAQFDAALKLAAPLEDLARRSRNVELAKTVQTRAKDLRTQQAEWAKVKPHLDKLKENPEDPDASLAVGRYYAGSKNDWTQALPLLVKSSAPAVKAAAARDIVQPEDAAAKADVGDLWWSVSEKESGAFKGAVQDRAASWYTQAVAELTGVRKLQIEKRIQAAAGTTGTAAAPGALTLLSYKDGLIRSIKTEDFSRVVGFSPNGRVGLVLGESGIHLYDLEAGKKVKTLTTAGLATTFAFSPDGARLMAGGYFGGQRMGEAVVWELATGAEQARFKQGRFRVIAVTFMPDGRAMLLGCNPEDDICRFFQVHDGKSVGAKLPWYAAHGVWSADSSVLFIGYSYLRGYARILDGKTGRELREIRDLAGVPGIMHYGLSRDARLAVASGAGVGDGAAAGGPRVYDSSTGKLVQQINLGTEKLLAVDSLAIFPDNRRLVTAHHHGTVVIWEIATGKVLQKLQTDLHATRAAVSPDARFLLVGGPRELRLYGVGR